MPISLRSLIPGASRSMLPVTMKRGAINVGSMGRYNGTVFTISPSFFQQMRALATDFREDAEKVNFAIDRAVAGYAVVCLGYAQQRSRGFLDAREQNPQFAWKIPVRRISGAYLLGWKVEHAGMGHWRTYNDSREAYYIEFGINHEGTGVTGPQGTRVRIRRPIMKLSVMDTLAFVRETEMDWNEFRGAFSLSTYHSPVAGLTDDAVNATLKATGGKLVVGAINTKM
jgi:hypothetical protein